MAHSKESSSKPFSGKALFRSTKVKSKAIAATTAHFFGGLFTSRRHKEVANNDTVVNEEERARERALELARELEEERKKEYEQRLELLFKQDRKEERARERQRELAKKLEREREKDRQKRAEAKIRRELEEERKREREFKRQQKRQEKLEKKLEKKRKRMAKKGLLEPPAPVIRPPLPSVPPPRVASLFSIEFVPYSPPLLPPNHAINRPGQPYERRTLSEGFIVKPKLGPSPARGKQRAFSEGDANRATTPPASASNNWEVLSDLTDPFASGSPFSAGNSLDYTKKTKMSTPNIRIIGRSDPNETPTRQPRRIRLRADAPRRKNYGRLEGARVRNLGASPPKIGSPLAKFNKLPRSSTKASVDEIF